MSELMKPLRLKELLEWILSEYLYQRSIFGIPEEKFFYKKKNSSVNIFNQKLDLPLGPAAGPHTQMSQNIVSAYLCGARFFELKTVQKLDNLRLEKPCIDAEDEAYNVEWSQELSLSDSFSEYLKAWFLIHFLKESFGFSRLRENGFIFNMSVGYDLEGIKSQRMDSFLEGLKDASASELFDEYRNIILSLTHTKLFEAFQECLKGSEGLLERLINVFENIPSNVSNSVTLSTMHGCPPGEIERIAEYLMSEKGLNTFVKLNPTLLGYEIVDSIINFPSGSFILDKNSFREDLQFTDALSLIKNLKTFSEGTGKTFGIKLSNTLPVKNNRRRFHENQMYMSGRTLFPLTVTLADKLSGEFNGNINISFSGGASAKNITKILSTGIYPVTMATELLKPGGYMRLRQMADLIEEDCIMTTETRGKSIDLKALKLLAEESLKNPHYSKSENIIRVPKVSSELEMFDCYISPCVQACPVHQDIPGYARLISEGLYARAFQLIVQKNPLPNITGYICDRKCMSNCQRCQYDFPVEIRELKKAAAEKGYMEYLKENNNSLSLKPNGIRAAVIGAGPGGLSAAFFLSRAGFDVTVFETADKAGGTVRHAIPNFRIPEEAINRDVEFIEKHGVKFIYNADKNFSVSRLKKEGYKYIYVAIGASEPSEISLSGTGRVYSAIWFLRSFNSGERLPLGKNVAVIGGGNSAMDSARAAKRIDGVENVFVIYRRTKEFMPADREEFDAAISEGVIFRDLLLPVSFSDKVLCCQKMELSVPEANGRMGIKALNNSFEYLEIDTVISAVGEHTDFQLLRENKLLGNEAASPAVSISSNESLLENVFIGGDALRGPSSVIDAVSDGKKTAEYIIAKEEIAKEEIAKEENRISAPGGSIPEIVKLKGTVFQNNAKTDSLMADRCLNCSLLCNICVEVCPNRANVAIPSADMDLFRDKFQIIHIDSLCNSCGNCETFCPHVGGAPYRDKLTLFHDEKSFSQSSNNGFFLDSAAFESTVAARYSGETGLIMIDRFNEVTSTSFEASLQDEAFHRFIKTITLVLKNHRYLIPESSIKKPYPAAGGLRK
ncbi:MAG TPA: putative selenate reductase subunit YgfK [Ignavibacteriales bacterium]|nr:putative selenate reductase subunit YgfK [Ignavibacteriales bacterium]